MATISHPMWLEVIDGRASVGYEPTRDVQVSQPFDYSAEAQGLLRVDPERRFTHSYKGRSVRLSLHRSLDTAECVNKDV